MEDVRRFWQGLPPSQQQMLVAGAVLAVAVAAMSPQVIALVLLAAAALIMHSRMPAETSFEPYFKHWFTEEYFPKASQKIQAELKERSNKETHLIDKLGTHFTGWLMGKTSKLQASAWYELVVKYSLPARQEDFFIMRTATVNLGSRQKPCLVTFWGVVDRWMLAPYIVVDFENTSLLEEAKQDPASQSKAR
mmetsp:Transcript_12406/g.29200  ORF Transcript_12406/g.29200 Transcript_12406/m.29200 type:complete len:192 (+) Transcript_12406:55-630(+)